MPIDTAPHLLIDRLAPTSVSSQLVAQLRAGITSGAIAPGSRLPPSRDLAQQLRLGRNTVVHAYEQLAAEGWLQAHGRNGTRVAARREQTNERLHPPTVIERIGRVEATPPAWKDWRMGQASTIALPLEVWRSACREAGRHLPPSGYGDAGGDLALRSSIATWLLLRRGVSVDPSQVVVTSGASEAIDLLARLLIRQGDVCAFESPGYRRAEEAFAGRGATIRRVPVDDEGMAVSEAFRPKVKPAVLHVTAAHQYPLGVAMSGARRQDLLSLSQQHRSLIIENEYDYEFVHRGPNHSPLFATAPERVILVGTFAKAVTPALRLGFVVGARPIVDRLADLVILERRHVSWPVQQLVRWLIDSGEMARHLRRVHRHSSRLLQHLETFLSAHLAGVVVSGDRGGQHLVLRGSDTSRTIQMEEALRTAGIAFESVSAFSDRREAGGGVLLAYGHMRTDELQRALRALKLALGSSDFRRPRNTT